MRQAMSCGVLCAGIAAWAAAGCGPEGSEGNLEDRAYVVSELSNDLFVLDVATMTAVGRVDLGAGEPMILINHMVALTEDGSKAYVTATLRNEVAVVDTRTLSLTERIGVGILPTHLVSRPGSDEIWVVNEADNSVSIIDTLTDRVVRTITDPSLMVPHFVRFAGSRAYVANIGGNQITVIDLPSGQPGAYRVVDVLVRGDRAQAGACAADPCGYADAQIDPTGTLWAAHIETGQVLVYDTATGKRHPDIRAGYQPWAVFVDPFARDAAAATAFMPNWGDATVSILDRHLAAEVGRSPEGDPESYGVNYSPRAPRRAFVLNRLRERLAVLDRASGQLVAALDVGGRTETAATTADGRYLLVPVSTANALVAVDMERNNIIARFEGVGVFPWSVATVRGQNYCH